MWNADSLSREQIQEFLKSSQAIKLAGCGRGEKYAWVELVLGAQQYGALGKRERGVVRSRWRRSNNISSRPEPGGVGTRGAGDERHGVGTQNECRQIAATGAMQIAASVSATVPIAGQGGRGNAGAPTH